MKTRMMNQMIDADLRRFIQNLSSRYYGESNEIQPLIMTKQIQYGIGIADISMITEPSCTCTMPCLSLRSRSPYGSHTPGDIDHERLQRLLSRISQYNTASAASSSLLRNLVPSFGQILQLELQRSIFKLSEKLERSKKTEKNRHKNEAIFKAFEEQSLSNESPAIPISAVINFSITSLRKVVDDDTLNETTQIDIIFEARIRLHLTPNRASVKCRLRTRGVITVQSFTSSKVFNTLDLKLEMDELYISMKKECKYVSKKIVNGIVGFDIFPSKALKKGQNQDESRNEQECASTSTQTENALNESDVVTYSTVATTDDNCLDFCRNNDTSKTITCTDHRSSKNKKSYKEKASTAIIDSAARGKKKSWLRNICSRQRI